MTLEIVLVAWLWAFAFSGAALALELAERGWLRRQARIAAIRWRAWRASLGEVEVDREWRN